MTSVTRPVALTALGVAATIKLLGQFCLLGPDPVPEAAATAATLSQIVVLAGLFLTGLCPAAGIALQDLSGPSPGGALPWRSLAAASALAALPRAGARLLSGATGHPPTHGVGPVLLLSSGLVLLGTLLP